MRDKTTVAIRARADPLDYDFAAFDQGGERLSRRARGFGVLRLGRNFDGREPQFAAVGKSGRAPVHDGGNRNRADGDKRAGRRRLRNRRLNACGRNRASRHTCKACGRNRQPCGGAAARCSVAFPKPQ